MKSAANAFLFLVCLKASYDLFFYTFSRWHLFVIAFRKGLETDAELFALSNFRFIGARLSKTLRNIWPN